MTEKKIVKVKGLKIKTTVIGVDTFECTFIIVCTDIINDEDNIEVIVYKISTPLEQRDARTASGILPSMLGADESVNVDYEYTDRYAIIEKNHTIYPGSKPMLFVRWLNLKEIIQLAIKGINNGKPDKPILQSDK